MFRVRAVHHGASGAVVRYLTDYLTKAKGERPGVWIGKGAAGLGLRGEVDPWHLERLLDGIHPISGQTLGSPFTARKPSTGKRISSVIGFDPTFSAPKSLSVWWALTGDEGVAECHDVAVAAAIEAIERRAATTRVRSNGSRMYLDTEGITAAVFRQSTSRSDDPQLHTHVVISSKVRTADGRWRALDARNLMKHQSTFGRVYQAALRAEVTSRYGVTWNEVINGQAEIAGAPIALIDLFSKRAEAISIELDDRLDEFRLAEGREPSRYERSAIGREVAADTRGDKTGLTADELRVAWEAEAAAIGFDVHDLLDGMGRAAVVRRSTVVLPTPEAVIAGLAEHRSTWQHLDVIRYLADNVQPPANCDGRTWARMIDDLACEVIALSHSIDPPVVDPSVRGSDGRSIWSDPTDAHATSDHVLAQENRIISWAIEAQSEPPTRRPIGTASLDDGQRAAAEAVAGYDRLVLVVGPAGSGKTTMLQAAVDRLRHERRHVVGFAPTAKAARVLAVETEMPADTVAKLLHDHRTRPDLVSVPNEATVVIDEAGMLATPDLHALVELAVQRRWRLVLVGDPRQLGAVGRGGMFAHLCATGRTVDLDQLHRFTHDWEAGVTLRLRNADPTAIDTYAEYGRVLAGDLNDHHATAAAYWIDCNLRGVDLAITTTRNDDVDEINRRIQRERLKHRELSRDRYAQIDTGVAFVGDVVVTRRNERSLRSVDGDHIKNRDRWTIKSIADDGSIVLVADDRRVHVPADYASEHVQLGYATTEHGAQGTTVDESLTLVTDATTHRGLYVGATRGRDRNTILVVANDQQLAIGRLQVVLSLDRYDTPAIDQWSRLLEKGIGTEHRFAVPGAGATSPGLGLS